MNDSSHVPASAQWMYQGIWRVLTGWFRVPRQPPCLPTSSGETLESFRPSPQWLRYLLLQFYLSWAFVVLMALVGGIVLFVAQPLVGTLLFAPVLIGLACLIAMTHLSLYLQYDTTWYVLNPRSLRLRRGIWTIHETTITFENIQNVSVSQGPLQRVFGIANVVVQTAGGAGAAAGPHGGGMQGGHVGLLEGLDNAEEIRNLILGKLKQSTSSGLGDEHMNRGNEMHTHTLKPPQPRVASHLANELELLRQIRDTAARLAKVPRS